MSFIRDDIEKIAEAIGIVHGHPEPKSYAGRIADAWHSLFHEEQASAPEPAPEIAQEPQATQEPAAPSA